MTGGPGTRQPPGPVIRRARVSDAPAIARVQIETWQDTYVDLLPTEGLLRMSQGIDAERWRRMIASDIVLVAEHKAAGIVGFGSGGPCRGGASGFDGEVYTLYVGPGHQNAGTGRRLLETLFAALREAGHGSALIWVLERNPARFFYEAMGGRRVAERAGRMWGATANEIAYGWPELALPSAEQHTRRAE